MTFAEKLEVIGMVGSAIGFIVWVGLTIWGNLLTKDQNRHFAEQNQIMRTQGGLSSMSLPDTPPSARYKLRLWPFVAMTLIMIMTFAAGGFSYYDRHYGAAQLRPNAPPPSLGRSATDVAKAGDRATSIACPPVPTPAPRESEVSASADRLREQLAQANAQIAVLQSQRQRSAVAPTPIQSTGPISWNGSFGFSQSSDANGEAIFSAIIFSGTNISLAPVQLSNAYIASELTGAQETLQVNMGGGLEQLAAIAEINQIPPNAPIELWASFKPALHASEFLAQWGKLRFHAEYGDIKYDKTFDEQTITDYLSRYPNAHVGPHITRKSGR